VCERAVRYFGKTGEYDRMLDEWRRESQDNELWAVIKDQLRGYGLDNEPLGLAIRALKRWVKFEDGGGISVRKEADMQPYGEELWVARLGKGLDRERLLSWIGQNWEVVKRREKARMKGGKNERVAGKGRVG
ncbi:hypothetical protein LTS18_006684, partial [Coniosporium uncinatum]